MPGTVINKMLNMGYSGNVSRNSDAIIDARILKSILSSGVETQAEVAFGEPVILNSDNTYTRFGSTATIASLAGIAVRTVKQATSYYTPVTTYKPGEQMDVLTRGSITVNCNYGTPTANGNVYLRITANAANVPNGVVGQFEAAVDPTDAAYSLLVTNAKWTTGYKDSNGIAELTILNKINA